MSQDVLELVKGMNLKDVETQMALQCAPLIMGLKLSNLLIIEDDNVEKAVWILRNSEISIYYLMSKGGKTTLLLYHSHLLEQYLSDRRVRELLKQIGYRSFGLANLLPSFRERYVQYGLFGNGFPHEMGLFLGYPIEDVKGFIEHKGKDFLFAGYWKVYSAVDEKVQLFQKYEIAKETLIQLSANGVRMSDMIEIFTDQTAGWQNQAGYH